MGCLGRLMDVRPDARRAWPVFPDGRFMSMRWRAMAWVSSAAVAAQTLAVALKPGPTTYSLRGGSLVNPAGVEWLGGVTEPLSELAGIGAMLLLVTGVVSLVVDR